MIATVEAVLLRIFLGENDRWHGRPLYEALVDKALATGMAGATVLPGPVGFGPARHMRNELNVDAGSPYPIVIEIVDTDANIKAFLAATDGMIESGLVTMEKLQARFCTPRPTDASAPVSGPDA